MASKYNSGTLKAQNVISNDSTLSQGVAISLNVVGMFFSDETCLIDLTFLVILSARLAHLSQTEN